MPNAAASSSRVYQLLTWYGDGTGSRWCSSSTIGRNDNPLERGHDAREAAAVALEGGYWRAAVAQAQEVRDYRGLSDPTATDEGEGSGASTSQASACAVATRPVALILQYGTWLQKVELRTMRGAYAGALFAGAASRPGSSLTQRDARLHA